MNVPIQPNQPGPLVQPSPISFAVGDAALPDGRRAVILQVETVVGSAVYLIDPETASTIAAQLDRTAAQARTGLLLAPAGTPLPPLNGQPQ